MAGSAVGDLLALAAELVAIPSESRAEGTLADHVQRLLEAEKSLEVTRVGDNVVARTQHARRNRLILAGHLDTVPAQDNAGARIDDTQLHGLGATDMKGGLAVMLDLARSSHRGELDVTYVFYAREEVAAIESGLAELWGVRPDLLEGDVAVLGEPTAGSIEAGCQGTMRLRVRLGGARAHTARPWMGRNAVHRLGGLLATLDAYPERRPVLDGCEYREALQAVSVTGGVAGNVVPDEAELVLNHRFAPDRNATEAEAHVHDVIDPWLEPDDTVEVIEVSEGARPALVHPLLHALIERNSLEVSAKLGWTDVARFAAHGIPALNFGPGDPTLAHTADERLDRHELEAVHRAIGALIRHGAMSR